ncbi:MAG: hypothetical protein EBZ69_01390 [Alphaproteobacteria bacterium]|nr:hypothetical protein [Alphaproteobacteria bacterium]
MDNEIQKICDDIRIYTIKEKDLEDKKNKELKAVEDWYKLEYENINNWCNLEKKIIGRQIQYIRSKISESKSLEKMRDKEYIPILLSNKLSMLMIERNTKKQMIIENYKKEIEKIRIKEEIKKFWIYHI